MTTPRSAGRGVLRPENNWHPLPARKLTECAPTEPLVLLSNLSGWQYPAIHRTACKTSHRDLEGGRRCFRGSRPATAPPARRFVDTGYGRAVWRCVLPSRLVAVHLAAEGP